MLSSRHPEKLGGLVRRLGGKARAGSVAEAAAFGEVLLLTAPYSALAQLGCDLRDSIAGKILDACNPYTPEPLAFWCEVEAEGVALATRRLVTPW